MNQIIYDIFFNLIGYLPYAMTTGLLLFSMILLFNRYILKIKLQDYDHSYQYRILLAYILYNYAFMVFCLTYLSREPGSRNKLDLMPFSTLSTNWRLDVYPIENILLFIPLGILLPLLWKRFRSGYRCFKAGLLISVMIELSQLITGRGYCQTDDVITNVIGTMVGYFIVHMYYFLQEQILVNH